jgi:hypothetical protein
LSRADAQGRPLCLKMHRYDRQATASSLPVRNTLSSLNEI